MPLILRVRLRSASVFYVGLKWALSAVSVLGVVLIVVVFVRIIGEGNVLLSIIAQRFGTEI